MKISESLWQIRSEQQTLRMIVSGSTPTIIPMTDIDSFVQSWKDRAEDATRRLDAKSKKHADSILSFVSNNQQQALNLLLWPNYKITVIATSDLRTGTFV